jgi:hypothetical protein
MKQMAIRVPYLLGVKVLADRLPPEPAYPFDLRALESELSRSGP